MWKCFQPGEAPSMLGLLFVNLQLKLYWRWSCRLDNGAAMMPLDAECLWIFATETIYHTSQCGIVNCHEKYKLFFGFFSKRESFRKRLRKRREGTRPQHYAMPTCTGDFATKDGGKTFDDIKWWNEFESKKLPDIKHQAKKLLMNKAWPVARGEMLGAGAGLNIEWGAAAAGQSQGPGGQVLLLPAIIKFIFARQVTLSTRSRSGQLCKHCNHRPWTVWEWKIWLK